MALSFSGNGIPGLGSGAPGAVDNQTFFKDIQNNAAVKQLSGNPGGNCINTNALDAFIKDLQKRDPSKLTFTDKFELSKAENEQKIFQDVDQCGGDIVHDQAGDNTISVEDQNAYDIKQFNLGTSGDGKPK